jgi:hypothetical protein
MPARQQERTCAGAELIGDRSGASWARGLLQPADQRSQQARSDPHHRSVRKSHHHHLAYGRYDLGELVAHNRLPGGLG